MNETVPTTAYSLLDAQEREAVDNYVNYAIAEQNRLRERIVHALYKQIPSEYIRRSRDALYRPLVRAAVAEKLSQAARDQDISPDRVIREHAGIAFSDISDYLEDAGFGEMRVKNLSQIPISKRGAVKSIESKPSPFGLHTKVVLHDKLLSLKVLGELMGIVAPDKPPVLGEYARPPAAVEQSASDAPELEYKQLLESMSTT